MIRGKDVAVSLLFVGSAAAAGYLLRSAGKRDPDARSKADVGARIVDDVPHNATVVDSSSRRLRRLPGASRAIRRAVRNDAREEWEHVTLERDGSWEIVDAIRRSLPYYDGRTGEYNGVYVKHGDTVIVLDAIGWARIQGQEPVQER
ncbi:hypothetical protein [Natronosalvus halobius]|uniref:hypothetical protein n=1 Tax=Natronosalvus halobius TaxID=2953746 RepID=UPI0020A1C2B7|nr:hypothetical protein [Natronosalvus halobius]USZ71131.1 hypothetical protein NGM15_13710 [Natronosalvus halobius]